MFSCLSTNEDGTLPNCGNQLLGFYILFPFIFKESDASRKCMEMNQSDKDMCAIYFLKYKSCWKFWHGIMMQRRQDGIKPHMPIAEERKRILASLGRAPYWPYSFINIGCVMILLYLCFILF